MSRAAQAFLELCKQSSVIPNVFDFLSKSKDLSARDKVDVILADQYFRWENQQAIPVEHYLQNLPDVEDYLVVPILVEEYGYLEERGAAPAPVKFVSRFQHLDSRALALLCSELEVENYNDPSDEDPTVKTEFSEPRKIGRYEVICQIGQGGFGEVLLAKDPTLDRSVAIKLLAAERLEAGADPAELLTEARTIAKLDHPNIVPVFDFGTTAEGRCFIVSKFIKGKDLRTLLTKSVSSRDAALIVTTLARALNAAHQVGIVHRDVKPGNIIVDEERQPHLLDFGLATPQLHESASEVYAGTPAYMSPEQSRGELLDGRTDIYSLGIVLYELLTGRRPFVKRDSSTANVKSSARSIVPPRQYVESIPRELESICLKALAEETGERFNTAGDFANALETWLSEDSSSSSTVAIDSRATDAASKRRRKEPRASKAKWLVGSLGVTAAAFASLIWFGWIDPRSALKKWSDEYLPEFARGYLSAGWDLKPDYESGYFYKSTELLTRAQLDDPSVVSVAVKTTAPRFTPTQVAWSPQGDRLAVVTRRGQLRVYDWDGRQLELSFIYRSATANDWVRCFCWHPFDGSAVIATGRGIVIGTANDRGDYDISLLIGKVYETDTIDYVVDQGRVLFVFGSKTGYRAWDPLTEKIFQDFVPSPGKCVCSPSLSNQYAYVSKSPTGAATLEFWTASWGQDSDESTQKTTQQWSFSRRKLIELDSTSTMSEISSVEISGDKKHIMLLGEKQGAVFEIDEGLELRGTFALEDQKNGAQGTFYPYSWPSQRSRTDTFTALIRDSGKITRLTFSSDGTNNEAKLKTEPEQLETQMLGARLSGSCFDVHPTRELIAVAYAGGLEIWNSNFETVVQVPGLDCVWDIIPMQLHDKCLLLRNDGGGVVVRTRGEPLGKVIPPVSPEFSGYSTIERNSIVEPELDLLQSSFDTQRPVQHRNLADYEIIALTTPSRRTFSLLPHSAFENELKSIPPASSANQNNSWNYGTTYKPGANLSLDKIDRYFHHALTDSNERLALAQGAQAAIMCDSKGNYEVHKLRDLDATPFLKGQIKELDRYLAITTDSDANSLFAGIGGPGHTKVKAINLESGTPLWTRELDGFENGVTLAMARQDVLVASWFGWRLIDSRWGKVLREFDPRAEHGFRHGQVKQHPLEGTLFSWHRYPEIEPAASWTKDLELQWLAFAASNGQWLILSPTGELLGQVESSESQTIRYTRRHDTYVPAVWADESLEEVPAPTDSLTLVKYHEDGRITCEPFAPLN